MSVHEGVLSSASENQSCSETAALETEGSQGGGGGRRPSVWAPLVVRAVLGALLLSAVAYLGHLSSRLDRYGPIRRLDERIMTWAETPREVLAERKRAPSSLGAKEAPGRAPHLAQSMQGRPSSANSVPLSPLQGTPRPGPHADCPEGKKRVSSGITTDGRVILNEATAAELMTLSGIGQARATAIIELRTRLKKFRKVTDLLRIRGIGWKSLQKLKEKVVVDRPQESSVTEPPATPPSKALSPGPGAASASPTLPASPSPLLVNSSHGAQSRLSFAFE